MSKQAPNVCRCGKRYTIPIVWRGVEYCRYCALDKAKTALRAGKVRSDEAKEYACLWCGSVRLYPHVMLRLCGRPLYCGPDCKVAAHKAKKKAQGELKPTQRKDGKTILHDREGFYNFRRRNCLKDGRPCRNYDVECAAGLEGFAPRNQKGGCYEAPGGAVGISVGALTGINTAYIVPGRCIHRSTGKGD